MPKQQQPSRKWLSGLLSFLVVLGVGILIFASRQSIVDWYRLRQYTASSAVAVLAEQTTMTDAGRQIFYTTHPQITGKEDFNTHCRKGVASEYSIVLGCYISKGQLYGDLYLYDVNDERLSGVTQVTAAHEMLHAAYDRLSPSERQHIDQLLLDTYRDLPDGRIKQTIAQYEANDPASVPSELHSILGTELGSLPPELEEYYQRYFTHRQAIVAFSEQYEGEFTKRQNQVAQYDAQLTQMKTAIETNQRQIETERASLDQEQSILESFRTAGNAPAFNERVATYNQQVANYNVLVQQTRAEIDKYNQLVEVRNNLALEVEELTHAIDSRPETL